MFYEDLNQFNEFCINSISKFDSNHSLKNYDFHRDRLSNWLIGKVDREKGEHFYRERALRYRFIKEFLNKERSLSNSSSSSITFTTSSETLSRIEKLLETFDYLTNGKNALKVRLLKSLPSDTGIYLIGSEHLCKLLVECFYFHKLKISPDKIYSITDHRDREWCYKHIQSLHNSENRNLFIIGSDLSKSTKDLAHKLQIPFKILEDIINLPQQGEKSKKRK